MNQAIQTDQIAAAVFATLSFAVVLFQIALIFGAPWGHLTLGGKFKGALPPRARVVPGISILLLLGFIAIVLCRAQLAFEAQRSIANQLIWGVVAYCALGVLANGFTPSRSERQLWLPVVSMMLVSSLIVALA